MSDSKNSVKHPEAQKNAAQRKPFIDGVLSLLLAIAVVLAIRSVLIEAFKIPSGSMIPTLYIGDQIFVNKASYGIRVPYTDWIGEKPIYLWKFDPPSRGDIIVFKYPEDPSIFYIKRITAVPGDTIEMRNKVLYVNGEALKREPVEEEKLDKIFKDLSYTNRYLRENMDPRYETFSENRRGIVMSDNNAHFSENFPPIKVPEDRYFVMGDNRDDSQDSRFWGFVPFHYIKGRAVVIWLSLWIDTDDGLDVTFRPERIGNILR